MSRPESCIILTKRLAIEDIRNIYRLIRTVDPIAGGDIYSVFVSTSQENHIDEEFVFDIARDTTNALAVLDKLCHGGVTACTLYDVMQDFIEEAVLT